MVSARLAGIGAILALAAVGTSGQRATVQERLGHPADARLLLIRFVGNFWLPGFRCRDLGIPPAYGWRLGRFFFAGA